MLELISLWYCWQKIGEIAEEKGRRGIGYQILIIVLFFGLEMTLALGGMVIFHDFPNFGGYDGYDGRSSGQIEWVFTYLGALAITIVIMGAILWGASNWLPARPKVKIGDKVYVHKEATVYTDMDSRSLPITKLTPGNRVEAVAATEIDDVLWVGIRLPDGQQGYVLGHNIEQKRYSSADTARSTTEQNNYITCSKCKFEQWVGYSECQKCGAKVI